MPISSASAKYALSAFASHDGVLAALTGNIGVTDGVVTLSDADVAYALQFNLAIGDTATIDLTSGAVTGATSGVAQVETATVVAAAGCTSNGNLAVTVTMGGVAYPLLVPLTVAEHTTDELIANEIRDMIESTVAIDALYTSGIVGAGVTLTRILPAANDATLNIAITAGLGVSAIVNSTNTTAGEAPTLIYRLSGQAYDTKDFQGVTLPAITTLKGLLIVHESGTTAFEINGNDQGSLTGTEPFQRVNNAGLPAFFTDDPLEFTGTTASAFRLVVVASTT